MFHPAAILVVWLTFALVLQSLGFVPLLVFLLLFGCVSHAVHLRWLLLLRRAKWLLITLWLVLAYSLPGVLWRGHEYLPSREGMDFANLHFLRLVVLLGSLALILTVLSRSALLAGLWSLIRNCAAQDFANRSVVRLKLVLDYLEHPLPAGGWRHLLLEPETSLHGDREETVSLALSPWGVRDSLLVIGALGATIFWVVWP